MSEDLAPGVEAQAPEVELSPVEQAAIEKGWKPKEEYSGDPERWRSAEVFLALDEPLKRIEHQSKEVKQLRAALEAFKEHHTKVEAKAFDRAIASLRAERKEAILAGDAEKALELEDQAADVMSQRDAFRQEASKPVVEHSQPNPEFVEWQNKNSWYNSNKAMTAAADAIGKELHEQGFSPAQVLRKVEEAIRTEFPNKFTNPNTKRPNAVEPGTRSGAGGKADAAMSETEVEIMRKIVKSGAMTEAQYKAELKRVKEL